MFTQLFKTLIGKALGSLLLTSMALCACHGPAAVSQSPTSNETPIATPKQATDPPEMTDPTCCDDTASAELKKAWLLFVKSGQYRLAGKQDMRDPEAMSHRPYAYSWGDLGFDTDASQSYHLAAIVVDTSRKEDDDRFGVVVFSAPRGEKGAYKPYWLLRNKDLSRAFFSGYSGYLELVINNRDGSPGGCDIRWNNQLRRYSCGK